MWWLVFISFFCSSKENRFFFVTSYQKKQQRCTKLLRSWRLQASITNSHVEVTPPTRALISVEDTRGEQAASSIFATRCRTISKICHKVEHNEDCHIGQLPRQGVCELSIGVLGGCSSARVYNDDNNDSTMTQISHSRSLRSACGLKTDIWQAQQE